MKQCNVTINIEPSLMSDFYALLQAGFTLRCQVGSTIENLFYDQFGLDPRFVEEKITTIFLNGKPVDDIGITIVHDGSVLALSGAMPGLVGATLRRKSPLSSFRQSISTTKTSEGFHKLEGYITVKLFNILLRDLGPLFLEKGIFIQAPDFVSFLAKKTSDFWSRCKQIIVNGESNQAQANNEWLPLLPDQGFIFLKVTSGQ